MSAHHMLTLQFANSSIVSPPKVEIHTQWGHQVIDSDPSSITVNKTASKSLWSACPNRRRICPFFGRCNHSSSPNRPWTVPSLARLGPRSQQKCLQSSAKSDVSRQSQTKWVFSSLFSTKSPLWFPWVLLLRDTPWKSRAGYAAGAGELHIVILLHLSWTPRLRDAAQLKINTQLSCLRNLHMT